MTKSQHISYVNQNYGGSLNNFNTAYASINKSKEVWWLNIPVEKFSETVHILLNAGSRIHWIELPNGFVSSVSQKFKIRPDKNVVDLEISADRSYLYMKDVKSGGTNFNFSPYIKETFTP